MQSSQSRTILCGAIAATILSACAGSGSNDGVPNAAAPLGAARNRFGQEGYSIALSGAYSGKFHDKMHGTSRVMLYLSQTQSTLGGAVINAQGSQGLAVVIAWVAKGRTISGTSVGPAPGSGPGYCAFSMSGSYKYRRLSGSYRATSGRCSGQTGTFTLWHKCYIPSAPSEDIRPERSIKPCGGG